jgi:insulysin
MYVLTFPLSSLPFLTDLFLAENDADELQKVSKQDVLDLFLARVHPSASHRSKLSVHVISQKPRPQKISAAAAQAFASIVRVNGVAILNEWQDELGSDQPPIAEFIKYWQGILVGDNWTPEATKELLTKIPPLMEKYPADGTDDNAVREGATYIKDVKTFKAALAMSEEPKPLVDWGDLPLSKF